MLNLRRSEERGFADHGWLQSFHSFSFAGYYDPRFMGWGNLRVINEDRIAAGQGFGTHEHRDMEILSYVLSGELAHRDNMGNIQGIRPGEVQRMSAGTGVTHSEFNHAEGQTTHFLQIWLLPDTQGVQPGYEQKTFEDDLKRGRLCAVAASTAQIQALQAAGVPSEQLPVLLHADAVLYAGLFHGDEAAELGLSPQRKAYVHLVRGSLNVNGVALRAGDALQVAQESQLYFSEGQDAEVLVFDLEA